jgi:hypothetical protein
LRRARIRTPLHARDPATIRSFFPAIISERGAECPHAERRKEMIELLISVCLIEGSDCRDVSMLYDAQDVSLMTCMVSGQAEAARWQMEHPAYRIERYRCGIAGAGGKSI